MSEVILPRDVEPITTRTEGGAAWITMNRPERLNAFVGTMRDDLADAVAAAAARPEVRVIVIGGAGKAFSAGADVDVMADLVERGDEETFAGFVRAGMRVVRSIREARQPVVAAVNGVAVGAGASLAVACDLRIASARARIGFTFNRIGLHPDWGASYFLPRLIGSGRASALIFSSRILEASEAEQWGLFEQVASADSFHEEVATVAAGLAAKPPLALAAAKATLRVREADELDEVLRREEEAQLRCFRTSDVREGIAAFLEKRDPSFLGR